MPSAPPRKVEAEALNATAIRVLWRSPTPGRQHGQIRGYQVHYVRMEGAEARGPPRIKDIMLADAQVGHTAGVAGAPGHCFLSTPHSIAGPPLTSLLSPPPPPPAQWEMDDTAEYVSSLLSHLPSALCSLHARGPQVSSCVPHVPSIVSDGPRMGKDSCRAATSERCGIGMCPQARPCLSLGCSVRLIGDKGSA